MPSAPTIMPSLPQATLVWLRIGLLSFGGPAGQIALLHREVVERRRWVGERRFLQALNFCTLLPGPEATQLATYLGWLMHGVRGGICAGVLFVAPGAVVMLALSLLYVTFGQLPLVSALFLGLRCAVLMLVIEALMRIARRALARRGSWLVAALAFAALFLFAAPFPLVVAVAGLIGLVAPAAFAPGLPGEVATGAPALLDALLAADPGRQARLAAGARLAGMAALAMWLAPVAALTWVGAGVFADIAWFFAKMAVVTVGGAYAVLAYVAQDAVRAYHWLSAPEMLAGLGLAETTPGPLILVLQFVGFMAGYRAQGIGGGLLGSALTLWVTFVPCFAFVFLGAPLMEAAQGRQALAGCMAAITATVVGVIANLALWFGLRVLFGQLVGIGWGPLSLDVPVVASLDPGAAVLAGLAAACLFGLRAGAARTLLIAAVAGMGLGLLG